MKLRSLMVGSLMIDFCSWLSYTISILTGEIKMFYMCRYTGKQYTFHKKPTTSQLGMTPSKFKTKLKQFGFVVPRDFFKSSYMGDTLKINERLYRFRWCEYEQEYLVDISCLLEDFDRWANSTDNTITSSELIQQGISNV